MKPLRGKFITFEGIEGVGKTTQVALAASWLREQGLAHVVTREPGGTALAEKIRDVVLMPREEAMPPIAELLLMFAARAVHLYNCIQPALEEGKWVLCDRFTDASFAYQGAGRGIATASIAALESLVQEDRQPDLTLLLDLPVEQGMQRVLSRGNRPDRFENEKLQFFERVRAGYLQRARQEPHRIKVIDAAGAAAQVHANIVRALQTCIEPRT